MVNSNVGKCIASTRGATLPEFAIILPLLVLVFIGVTEFGKLLSHITWISQTSYTTALVGAERAVAEGQLKMAATSQFLYDKQNRNQISEWEVTSEYDTGKALVKVHTDAKVKKFFHQFFNLNLGVTVAAPQFVPAGAVVENPDQFENPIGTICESDCNPPPLCQEGSYQIGDQAIEGDLWSDGGGDGGAGGDGDGLNPTQEMMQIGYAMAYCQDGGSFGSMQGSQQQGAI